MNADRHDGREAMHNVHDGLGEEDEHGQHRDDHVIVGDTVGFDWVSSVHGIGRDSALTIVTKALAVYRVCNSRRHTAPRWDWN